MMQKLIRKGEEIAAKQKQQTKMEIKSALQDALPDHISVEDKEGAIEVSGPRLSQKLIDNSSLRDVAFLMRGVR